MPNQPQLFLSYSRTNQHEANALRYTLEQAGFTVFKDDHSIRAGDNWMEVLQNALENCTAFILLVGQDGVQRWVLAETQYALSRHHDEQQKLPIFPVLLPTGDLHSLPPFLSMLQVQRWQEGEALTGDFVQAIRDKSEIIDHSHLIEGNPYQGLSAFTQQQAHLFFGRHKETLEALKYLGTQRSFHPNNILKDKQYCRWLQIEGNSGAGKSSLVRAGMLPLIQQGCLWERTGYDEWVIIEPMFPGKEPLRQLCIALKQTFSPGENGFTVRQLQQEMENDERTLSHFLDDYLQPGRAFLLVVDQFEELFTFAEETEKQQFDAQLAYALSDENCPLFLISTVRIDFLEGFERLGKLSERYNDQCKRYLLKTLSQDGIREIIEKPAQLAGLDVKAITPAILSDTENEPGALPLVENALHYLWEKRKGNTLCDELYVKQGRLAGLLGMQADLLLEKLEQDKNIKQGKEGALELLLALTRINPQGNHTRERLTLSDARQIAGNDDEETGQKIINTLSGKKLEGVNQTQAISLRLITTIGDNKEGADAPHYQAPEYTERYVDLIHETLIRPRPAEKNSKTLVGYWQTLYQYIEKNRDRLFFKEQLKQQTETWQNSHGLGRWWHLASWRDLKQFKKIRGIARPQRQFIRWSKRMAWLQSGLLVLLLAFVAESYLWTLNNGMPPDYMLTQQKFRLMHWGLLPEPLPEVVDIPLPDQPYLLGEYDQEFGEMANDALQKRGNSNINNFGYPPVEITFQESFAIGQYEVSYEQYDYYVWQQQQNGVNIIYPSGATGDNGRGLRAVTQVSWHDANVYLEWLSSKTGDSYRLPTEAEWEYAARAGTETAYWMGDDIGNNQANCDGCGSQRDTQAIAPVGSFKANAFGLYDTAGNVWEWTCSLWKPTLDGSENECKPVANKSGQRVLRGGSWVNKTDWLRSSARFRNYSANRNNIVGFRVLRASRTN